MTTLREAAQQALEALRGYRRELGCEQPCDAELALQDALAQEKQEPVAWMMINRHHHSLARSLHWTPQTDWHITWEAVPLYTHPPRREPEQMLDSAYKSACGIISEQDKTLAELETVNAALLAALNNIEVSTHDAMTAALARAAIAKTEEKK